MRPARHIPVNMIAHVASDILLESLDVPKTL